MLIIFISQFISSEPTGNIRYLLHHLGQNLILLFTEISFKTYQWSPFSLIGYGGGTIRFYPARSPRARCPTPSQAELDFSVYKLDNICISKILLFVQDQEYLPMTKREQVIHVDKYSGLHKLKYITSRFCRLLSLSIASIIVSLSFDDRRWPVIWIRFLRSCRKKCSRK